MNIKTVLQTGFFNRDAQFKHVLPHIRLSGELQGIVFERHQFESRAELFFFFYFFRLDIIKVMYFFLRSSNVLTFNLNKIPSRNSRKLTTTLRYALAFRIHRLAHRSL